jgi:predicted RNase H-like HicB family nuclease
MKLTAIIEAEGDGYVSLCPELDIASQGDSIEQARDNLREALELFFECASAEEVKQRLRGHVCSQSGSCGCATAPKHRVRQMHCEPRRYEEKN